MPGKRLPYDVIEARGAKHLSKSEKANRQAGEVKNSEPVKQLRAPSWLPEAQRGEFNRISGQLIALMPSMVSRLDGDTIAAYCMAHAEWLSATKLANQSLNTRDLKGAAAWSQIQDRYFKQCRTCAEALGMTITSRCRLVVPEAPAKAEDNPFLSLLGARADA
jgi:P27 family predicted phage terminase small subunit